LTDLVVHVVLIRFRPEASAEAREAIHDALARLPDLCGGSAAGIVYWRSGWNLDRRKGFDLMEFALFEHRAAFEAFRAHPAHQAFSARLSKLADWVVGDLGADAAELAGALASSSDKGLQSPA
jgi:hypothetical protein